MKLIVILLLLVSCGKQVKTRYVVNDQDNTNQAKILELESKLEANDLTITNLNTAISELQGDQSELILLIETLQDQNAKLLTEIKRLRNKRK